MEEFEALRAIYEDDLSVTPTDKQMRCTLSARDSTETTWTLEMSIPLGYPTTEHPKVRAVGVGHLEDQTSSKTMQEFVNSLPLGEPIIFSIFTKFTEMLMEGRQEVRGTVHSNAAEQQSAHAPHMPASEAASAIVRQWITFIGFYTKAIRKAFCHAATDYNCTGFLMPGKPAVAAVEGRPEDIAEFLKHTRTVLFAKVPPASRKMTVSLCDDTAVERVFLGFEEVELHTGSDPATKSAHKRKDMADLGKLQQFLEDKGLQHAFRFIFDTALANEDA